MKTDISQLSKFALYMQTLEVYGSVRVLDYNTEKDRDGSEQDIIVKMDFVSLRTEIVAAVFLAHSTTMTSGRCPAAAQ